MSDTRKQTKDSLKHVPEFKEGKWPGFAPSLIGLSLRLFVALEIDYSGEEIPSLLKKLDKPATLVTCKVPTSDGNKLNLV
jgi:hypothetical protein